MFEIGKTYQTCYMGDHNLVEQWTITRRTAKTITAKSEDGETVTRRIYIYNGEERANVSAASPVNGGRPE